MCRQWLGDRMRRVYRVIGCLIGHGLCLAVTLVVSWAVTRAAKWLIDDPIQQIAVLTTETLILVGVLGLFTVHTPLSVFYALWDEDQRPALAGDAYQVRWLRSAGGHLKRYLARYLLGAAGFGAAAVGALWSSDDLSRTAVWFLWAIYSTAILVVAVSLRSLWHERSRFLARVRDALRNPLWVLLWLAVALAMLLLATTRSELRTLLIAQLKENRADVSTALRKQRLDGSEPAIPGGMWQVPVIVEEAAQVEVRQVSGAVPLRFVLTGTAAVDPRGRSRWVGTRVGKMFWPQLELIPNFPDGQRFEYALTLRPDHGATLLILEAGPWTNKMFGERLVSQSQALGFDLAALRDVRGIPVRP